MVFKVYPDTATSERAGAGGMYQIGLLLQFDSHDDCSDDHLGKDVTNLVNQGMLFHSEDDQLTPYLAEIFGIPESEVEYCFSDEEDHPDWPFK